MWTPHGPLQARDVFMQGGRVASIEPTGGAVEKVSAVTPQSWQLDS